MPSLIPHLLVIWLSVQRLAWCTERSSTRERFKVVIAPLICKRICLKGQCQDTCEQGNNTTLIAENGQASDTLIGPGFRVVVCPLTCMNGGVCSSRKHCLCPPGFTGRLCQFPLQQTQQAQAARGNKQPVYPVSLKPDGLKLVEQSGIGRTQLTQTHSVFTLPFSQVGHHSSEVQINVRVHHTPDTSVVIQPLDQSDVKLPHKTVPRLLPQRHKPKGRCFQETTPKQACNSTPLPVLTNQEDCCGSVGNSWGQNKCYQCPKLPNASVKQTIVEEYGSTCPQGYKRFNSTHCQDINECSMQGVCQNGDCLNTLGSFKCSCKAGLVLDRHRCVESPAEQAQCFLMASEARGCEYAVPTHLTQKICCCTVGKAWGRNCERCPQDGTVAFSKICPAGKGYFLQDIIESVAFPPIIFPRKPVKEEPKRPERPPETTTTVQAPTTTSSPRVPVVKPTPPTIIRMTPGNDPFETQTKVFLTDECRLSRNICGRGECENSLNGHICHCHPGYHLNPQRNICEDDDECKSEPCGHGRGLCVNIEGSYKCLCRQGYKHMVQHGRLKCIDVNECSKQDICGVGGQCINLPGSYKCECHSGFRSKSHRHPACEDINECLNPDTCPNEQCENTPGSYECVPCLPGHEARSGTCYDINECQKPGICPNGRCENLPGTYRCLCNEGFLPLADSKGCNDIDECEDVRLCANGHCINTEGSFQCQCYPGYQRTQEGSHCEDINECERPSNCQRGHCINSMGSYHCECQKGYKLVGGRRCQDFDECAADRFLCQPYGSCENRPGSYVCACKHGYVLSEDKHSCEAVHVLMDEKKECYLNLDDTVFCDSVLATNVTKQECCCSIGVGWGDHCEIYPCPVSHSAEFHFLCPNGQGLYNEEGLQYSLPAFHDIDECSLFADEICKKGRCENTLPGYECYCQQGFYYDGNLLECIDVNECHDESLCTNGHCVNTEGSFYCNCKRPWTPDSNKKKCVMAIVADVNECGDRANCKNGHCVDTPGSYYCICSPPWTLATDRNSCVTPEEQADVNECQDPSYCKNGRCENTPGSFHCFCDPPLTFSAALKQCVYDDRTAAHKDVCFLQVDEGLICSEPRNGMVVTYSECCCHYGRGWGPECNTCPPRNSEMFSRLCEMHLETESDGEQDFLAAFANYNPGDSSEEDSDECSCANGRCVRSYLGTMCECNTGFRLDHSRTRCIDIDECAEPGARVSPCKNARCVNTAGSYKCFCKYGFVATRRPNICLRRRTR
ncbi:latent-transforming growth factor beta-binding protein 3 isoform X2 [Hippoglossus hippoglossus]|uniref:latent-transforming growth factor beta-binding protein 3 isoform X2 n=1 Tax=Hippoglossus hippoglossus TaxID=8267 RepID=UPI00148C782D|nr:latent-transforming growth factor beta-binding protein 3 isoform X2 [Hippoglossus hippoglossus]XP_035034061.1 latent-transforming growth factor beta-binding protein 3 isoform X2 [Hippoglossus stenolepis]